MITGTHKSVILSDCLDCDRELGVQSDVDDWLTKSMAITVIKHLAKVFGLGSILEAVEKYEEENRG